MFSKISSGLLGWINRTEPSSDPQPAATSKVEAEKNGDCGGANLEDRGSKENLQEEEKEIKEVIKLTRNDKVDKNESKLANENEFKVVSDEKLERNRTIGYPVRAEANDCWSYLHTGLCKFGINCKFNHPPKRKLQVGKVNERKESLDSAAQEVKGETDSKVAQIDCKHFGGPRGFESGNASKVNHSTKSSPKVELNFMGLPIRPGTRDCSFYMCNGSCKHGVNCWFNHPNPTSVGEYDNQSGESSQRSILLPNASHSTPGSWSPLALIDSPPYVPLMFPSTQGVTSLPEWHGHYQASVYPPGRSTQLASAYATNSRPLEINVYTHQEQQILVDDFPERPGHPKCNCFLETGYCKHRSACKFHHPKNEIPMSTSCALSDSGLPLRPAEQPLIQEAVASPSYDASSTQKSVDRSFVFNVPKSKLKQPKPILKDQNANQNVRCELCNIQFASVQLFSNHLYGKKHTNNLQNLQAQKQMSQVAHASQSTNRSDKAGKTGTLSGKGMSGSTRVVTDLERKEQKLRESGIAVQSLRVSAICNVVCTGERAFAEHLSGKKHLTQGQAFDGKANASPTSATLPQPKFTEKITAKPRNGKDLVVNKEGKKQKAYVEKLQNPKVDPTSPASTASPPPMARLKELDDVETKIPKVLECGAPEDAVRTCTICNVVCNSVTMFNSHLAGQKHAATVKQKQAGEEADIETSIADVTNAQIPVTQSRVTVEEPSNKSCSSGEMSTPSGKGMAGLRSVLTDSTRKEWKLLEGGIAVGSLKGQALAAKANLGPTSATSPIPKSTEEVIAKPRNGEDLVVHKEGKKHQTDVEKSQTPKVDPSCLASTATPSLMARLMEPEDLETKIRKVLECGAPEDSVRICTICNVVCNSESVFNTHRAGQRHAAMVKQKQAEEEAAIANATNAQKFVTESRVTVEKPTHKICSSGEISTPSRESMQGARSVVTDLKRKEQKLLEGGNAVQSPRACAICNVVCSGEVAFAEHVAGKKHFAQVGALTTEAEPKPNSATSPKPNSTEKIPTEPRNGDSLTCEVCKIRCTRFEDLVIHKQGKKHKTKVEELQNPKTVDPTSPASPLAVSKEPDGVEAKIQKVLNCGEAEASPVKNCTICYVMCKSESVFNSHMAGKRHATVVKRKQAQEEAARNGDAANAQGLVTPPDSWTTE